MAPRGVLWRCSQRRGAVSAQRLKSLHRGQIADQEVVVDGFNGVMQMLDSRGGVGDAGGFDITPASPSFNQPAADNGAFEDPPF